MNKFTSCFLLFLLFSIFTASAQEDEVIAVIQEPFVVLLDPDDGSVIDNQFIDLTPLSQGTPKALLQVEDELWISDQIEDRIDRFDLDGNFISTIDTGLDNIKGMEVVDDEVWVTNAGGNNGAPNDAIVRFDFDGTNLGFYDTGGDSSFDIIDVGNNEVFISYIGVNTRIERRDYNGNVLGNIVDPGIVTFIQQMELIQNDESVLAAVFSNNGPNTAGLYEFSVVDPGSLINFYPLGSLRGVAQLENGNILVSGGSGFGIQILDISTSMTTNVNSTDSAQYFGRITTCITPTPVGDANQTFTEGATLDDIVVDPVDVIWFATETDAQNNENPLPNTTVLVDGETYYAVSIIDSCLSEPLAVTVEIILGLDNFTNDSVKIYPNPTSNVLSIESNSTIKQLTITNLLGQITLQKDVDGSNFNIELGSFKTGIYLLQLENEEGVQIIKKIIKE